MTGLFSTNGHLFSWSEATWTLVDEAATLIGLGVTVITLLFGLLAWVRRDRLRDWLRGNRFPQVGGLVREDARWSAIIFTVSQVEVPTWVMQRAKPAWIGLIGSTARAEPVAALEANAAKLNIRVIATRLVADPDDPQLTMVAAREILAALRAAGVTNVAVDLTGGKVPMSLGAFMAAEEARVDSLYVSTEYDQGRPRPETARIRRVSGPPAMIG